MAREEPIAPNTAMAAATKNNEQNRRRHESGLNVRFGFVIIDWLYEFGLVSRELDAETRLLGKVQWRVNGNRWRLRSRRRPTAQRESLNR